MDGQARGLRREVWELRELVRFGPDELVWIDDSGESSVRFQGSGVDVHAQDADIHRSLPWRDVLSLSVTLPTVSKGYDNVANFLDVLSPVHTEHGISGRVDFFLRLRRSDLRFSLARCMSA